MEVLSAAFPYAVFMCVSPVVSHSPFLKNAVFWFSPREMLFIENIFGRLLEPPLSLDSSLCVSNPYPEALSHLLLNYGPSTIKKLSIEK